jgi:hypothetical protein
MTKKKERKIEAHPSGDLDPEPLAAMVLERAKDIDALMVCIKWKKQPSVPGVIWTTMSFEDLALLRVIMETGTTHGCFLPMLQAPGEEEE